jgi:hypothetical protein
MPGTSLRDYGLSKTLTLVKRSSVALGTRTVGYYCYKPDTNSRVYVSERDSTEHRYDGDDPWYDFPFDCQGYGLSMELFGRLTDAGVGAVYIAETDTGDVYNFGFDQFVGGTPINVSGEAETRGYEKDPQKVVPLTDAVEVYGSAYPEMYEPVGGT